MAATKTRQVRIDPEAWKAFGDALESVGEVDRSTALRLFAEWATADPRGALAAVRAALTEGR
ncbi:hypothetical protein [Candidatus Frankia alpina]|uniref:Uncharacterized protein n=1 Tax=Candidatus Frankia alpina TaxID=2699483 RepID=A0A4S5EPL0_9ACTN|nr:hypothetical protein [Candidatus Frankia alpina]THJ74176.1 hypothetical protein E7Y31_13020 [Candidatus Frankia alpina]